MVQLASLVNLEDLDYLGLKAQLVHLALQDPKENK